MKLTNGEKRFFSLIEKGWPVNNDTAVEAKCDRMISTVARRTEYVDENGAWVGPVPIPDSVAIEVKKLLRKYHNEKRSYIGNGLVIPAKNEARYLFDILKDAKRELSKLGYTVIIKVTQEIEI